MATIKHASACVQCKDTGSSVDALANLNVKNQKIPRDNAECECGEKRNMQTERYRVKVSESLADKEVPQFFQ